MPLQPRNFLFAYLLRQVLFVWLAACLALVATTGRAQAQAMVRSGLVAEVAGNAWRLDPVNRAWTPLQQNQAIAQGDHVRTDALSRVTVRAGSSTLWLDAQTEVQILQMNEGAFTMRLLAGDLTLRMRDPQVARSTRVQTREGVVTQPHEGLVRVGQDHRATRVGVLQGRAQFDSDPGAPLQRAWLREGEQAAFVWDESARMERQSPAQDHFSAWFNYRDQVESGLNPRPDVYYAPPEVARTIEPQRYENRGTTVIEYGRVWIPTPPVVRGWEPHRRDVLPQPHHYPQPQPFPHVQSGAQPPRSNHGLPDHTFERDRGWKPPEQHQRPVVPASPVQTVPHPVAAPRPTPPAMQPVPVVPVGPRPAYEERQDNPRHSKRDNLDREMRKKEIDPLR
ncbi:MAG TPA: hypothetical protein PLL01_03050 [Rhodoferax sp.]|jgi:hypothetical protein|nr:hypothetical protein [Rhodoferax sp.]